jgi:RNA polymerase sigma factor (sigma-70 family)
LQRLRAGWRCIHSIVPSGKAKMSSTTSQAAALNEIRREDVDQASFATLVLPCLGDAYALACWLIGNRDEAEDVVLGAYLRAFRAIGGLAEERARSWVLTIVRNAAHAWLRAHRPSALLGAEPREHIPARSQDEMPNTAAIAKAGTTQLEVAITALPMPYRETIVLRDILGLTYRDISEVTGVALDTVMLRLARGRGDLMANMTRDRRSDDVPGAKIEASLGTGVAPEPRAPKPARDGVSVPASADHASTWRPNSD